jgi:integrase
MPKIRSHGEGSIETLPSGSFRAVISIVNKKSGRRERLSFTHAQKSEVIEWLNKARNDHTSGRLSFATKTLHQFADEWIARVRPTVEPSTAAYYGAYAKKIQAGPLAKLKLRQITRSDVERELPEWGTVDQQSNALQILRMILKDAVIDGFLPYNPATDARPPKKSERTVEFWTAEEVARILKAAEGKWLEAYYWLAFDTGARPGELLGLHWPEVDLTAGLIKITQAREDLKGKVRMKGPKTKSSVRQILITLSTAAVLTRHREAMKKARVDTVSGPVFVGPKNRSLLTQWNFHRGFVGILKEAKVKKYRPYTTRHTCATLLLAAGVNIKIVSERLGHSDITTTLKYYAHCMPNSQEVAAHAMQSILPWPS